jgi:hypothetical protein
VAVCPSCSRHLVDLGPRAALHEVVVAERASEEEILRFPLEVDCPVIVGRGAAVKGINLAMYGDSRLAALHTVSRQHLMMRMENAGQANWRLAALDLNSTNGTMVERWVGNDFAPPRDVLPGAETYLGTRDRLILGDTVLLRLSGKRYLAEPTNPQSEVQYAPDPAGVTTIVRRSDVG